MRTVKLFPWAIIALIGMMLVPEMALAAGGPGFQIANMLKEHAWNFFSKYLLPEQGDTLTMVLLCGAVCLTMSWMLVVEKVRTAVGRTAGIPIALFLAGLIIPMARAVIGLGWGILPWWGKGIAIIMVIISFGAIIQGAIAIFKGAIMGLFNFAKDTFKKEKPSMVFSVVGALFIAGFINSSMISNEKNFWLPSILSSIGGIVAIIWRFFRDEVKTKYHTRRRRKHGEGKVTNIVLPDGRLHCIAPVPMIRHGRQIMTANGPRLEPCNTVSNAGERVCRKCHTPFTDIPWKCAQCNTADIPHDRTICPKCQAPKPVLDRPESCLSVPPAVFTGTAQGVCPHCRAPNRSGYRFCKECGKPPTAIVRSSSTDEDFGWGNVSNGTPRRLLKR